MYGPTNGELAFGCLIAVIVFGVGGYFVGQVIEWMVNHVSVNIAWN